MLIANFRKSILGGLSIKGSEFYSSDQFNYRKVIFTLSGFVLFFIQTSILWFWTYFLNVTLTSMVGPFWSPTWKSEVPREFSPLWKCNVFQQFWFLVSLFSSQPQGRKSLLGFIESYYVEVPSRPWPILHSNPTQTPAIPTIAPFPRCPTWRIPVLSATQNLLTAPCSRLQFYMELVLSFFLCSRITILCYV